MNLIELYNTVGAVSLGKIGVNAFFQKSPYIALQEKSVPYASVCFTVESVGRNENLYVVHCILYYADRLENNADNIVEVQNDAVNILFDIIRELGETDGIADAYTEGDLELFSQRLVDYCAGGYVNIVIEIPVEECEDYSV